jgi:hypothetical protein
MSFSCLPFHWDLSLMSFPKGEKMVGREEWQRKIATYTYCTRRGKKASEQTLVECQPGDDH